MPIGTRVRLASGGPTMIVVANDLPDREYVTCAWGNGQEADFRIVTLDAIRKRHVLQ